MEICTGLKCLRCSSIFPCKTDHLSFQHLADALLQSKLQLNSSRVNGPAQGPRSVSLVVSGFKLTTFQSVEQRPNHWALTLLVNVNLSEVESFFAFFL